MYMNDLAAVTPDEAAASLVDWVDTFDISKSGQFWAPRGPGYVTPYPLPAVTDAVHRDIGTAEQTLGPKDELSTPLHLPW